MQKMSVDYMRKYIAAQTTVLSSEYGKRVVWVDVAKGIGIILVMLGHMVDGHGPIGQFIWSFHMPLFFFLSGLFFKPLFSTESLYRKIRQLIFPCVLFTIIICVVEYYVVDNNAVMTELKCGLPHTMWFLTTLFLAMAWSTMLMKQISPLAGICISLCIACLFKYSGYSISYSLSSTFISSVFLLAGFTRRFVIVGGGNIIFLIIIQLVLIYLLDIRTALNINRFSLVGVVVAFIGTIIVVSISNKITNKFVLTIITWLGRNTLVLMSVHMIFLSVFCYFFNIEDQILSKALQLLFVFSMSIVSVFVFKKPLAFLQGKRTKRNL